MRLTHLPLVLTAPLRPGVAKAKERVDLLAGHQAEARLEAVEADEGEVAAHHWKRLRGRGVGGQIMAVWVSAMAVWVVSGAREGCVELEHFL